MFQTRAYRPGDEAAIIALFHKVFGAAMIDQHWRWKYRNALEQNALPIVATTDSGELVGHAGTVYLEGCHQGQSIPFLQICDIMVAPEVRGHLGSKNLYTLMVRELFDRLHGQFPNAFAYGFPGTRPYKLGRYACGYECIEIAQETRIAAAPPAPWTTIQRAPLVSAELDRLWHRLKNRFGLCVRRDAAYVRWRYAEHPTTRYERVNFFSWGRLVGWGILHRKSDKTQVIDILAPPRRLPGLLAALGSWLESENAPPAVVWLPEPLTKTVSGESTSTEVHTTNVVRGFRLRTPEVQRKLFYTMGDLDIF